MVKIRLELWLFYSKLGKVRGGRVVGRGGEISHPLSGGDWAAGLRRVRNDRAWEVGDEGGLGWREVRFLTRFWWAIGLWG